MTELPEPAPISCTEVWGGNRAADAALELPGITGWILSRPFQGDAAGGDVHYVSSCGTGKITRVLLADVSGHGAAAAEMGGRLRKAMQRYLNHEQPHKLAARLNRDMAELSENSGRFATALVITFFAPRGRMTICNAGHPTPLIYRAARKSWDTIDQPDIDNIANLPLGVLEESGYVGRGLTLQPDDLVLAYTDCVTEARAGGDGQMLGEAGLLEVLRSLGPRPCDESPGGLTRSLLEAIERRGFTLDDDLTAVALKCTHRCSGAGVAGRAAGTVRFLKQLTHPRQIPWPDGLLRRH